VSQDEERLTGTEAALDTLDAPDTADSLIRALAEAPRPAVPLLSTVEHDVDERHPAGAGSLRAMDRAKAAIPAPGTIIDGRYVLDRELGSGGMGVVFAARNIHTQKAVALKLLLVPPDSGGRSIERTARFLREARAAGRVRHPNVVDMIDVGGDPGQPYLVMELLHGRSLWTHMQERRLSQAEVLEIMLSAMRGVAEAHRQGVIHRDLKPDNIFLAELGDGTRVTKVLDFGVSRITERAGDSHPTTLTRAGHVIGTPSYMPLEQLRGNADVDARADVYSLGVVLYEALAGKRPFDAQNEHDLGIKMATESPTPLSTYLKQVEPTLEAAVMRALARKPADRYRDVEAFIAALEAHRSHPHPGRQRLLRTLVAALAVVVLLGGLLWWTQSGQRANEASLAPVLAPPKAERTHATPPPTRVIEPKKPSTTEAPPVAARPVVEATPAPALPRARDGKPRLVRPSKPPSALGPAPARPATKLLPDEF